MDPITAIAAGISTAGSIGSAALQRRWAIKDWERVNAYNHPKEQIRRLKEANLPLAAMFSGAGGSTSSDVRGTEVDPTLGTAKGMEFYFQNRLQKKQLELLDAQVRTEQARGETQWKEANIKANEATLSNDMLQYLINKEGADIVAPAFQQPSNQIQGVVRDRKYKEAQLKTQEVIAEFQKAKSEADVAHVLQTIKLGKQQWEYNKIMQNVDKILLKNLDKPENNWIQALIFKWFLKK